MYVVFQRDPIYVKDTAKLSTTTTGIGRSRRLLSWTPKVLVNKKELRKFRMIAMVISLSFTEVDGRFRASRIP